MIIIQEPQEHLQGGFVRGCGKGRELGRILGNGCETGLRDVVAEEVDGQAKELGLCRVVNKSCCPQTLQDLLDCFLMLLDCPRIDDKIIHIAPTGGQASLNIVYESLKSATRVF